MGTVPKFISGMVQWCMIPCITASLLWPFTHRLHYKRHERKTRKKGHPQGGTIRWQWVAAMVAAPIMLGGAQWAKWGVFFDFDSTMMLELSWGKMVL